MNCAGCGKEHLGISGLMPRPAGRVPGLVMAANDMLCGDCSRKVPIDQTSKERIPGEDDDLGEDDGYPF